MHQLSCGSLAYSHDHDDWLPYYAWLSGRPQQLEWWVTQVASSIDRFEPRLYRCPVDRVPPAMVPVYLDNGTANMADRLIGGPARRNVLVSYRGSCDLVEGVMRTIRGRLRITTDRVGRKTTSWQRPNRAIELVEGAANATSNATTDMPRECFQFTNDLASMAGNQDDSWQRHRGTTNVLFINGHVDRHSPTRIGQLARFQEHRF